MSVRIALSRVEEENVRLRVALKRVRDDQHVAGGREPVFTIQSIARRAIGFPKVGP